MFEASHVERVIRHLVRFGATRADAEDLAQEALVIAWRKQDELDRDRSLDAWLYGITRNVFRNHARSQRRHPMTDEPPEQPADDVRDPTDVVAFRDALGALPETHQDVVILHELEEYTLKETADLLAIPFDTAKDRLRRAREQLRDHLQAPNVATERRATRQLAKAAAPAVLVAVLASISRSASAATTASKASASKSATLASKLVLGGTLVAGIALGVVVDHAIVRRPQEARFEPQRAATGERADVPAPVIADAHVPDPESVTAAPDAALHAPDAGSNAPTAEAQLIERARVALRRGDTDEALRTLMSHERRFAGGQLAEERDVLLVEAYLAAGNVKLARERLEQYNATYPNGLHKQRALDAARQLGL